MRRALFDLYRLQRKLNLESFNVKLEILKFFFLIVFRMFMRIHLIRDTLFHFMNLKRGSNIEPRALFFIRTGRNSDKANIPLTIHTSKHFSFNLFHVLYSQISANRMLQKKRIFSSSQCVSIAKILYNSIIFIKIIYLKT